MSPKRGGTQFRELRIEDQESFGAIVLSGRYHHGMFSAASSNDLSINTINRLYVWPFWVGKSMSIDQIAVQVQTAKASSHIRAGMYGSGQDGLPLNLLTESAEFDSSTTGSKSTDVTAIDLLGPKLYWAAAVTDVSAVALKGRGSADGLSMGSNSIAGATVANTGHVAHTFGALPDPFGAFTIQNVNLAAGAVLLRVV